MGQSKFRTEGEKATIIRKQVRKSRAKIRRNRHAQGLCTECGQPNDRENVLHCTKCKNQIMELHKTRSIERIKAGICIQCGKKNDRIGMQHCSKCSEKNNLKAKERRRKKDDRY
jgi:DNA-directed RNA polymerase subunit RPC12/RpoP